MRVTQNILFGNFMRDVNINRAEMGKIQSDLSSGKRVRIPSHDPVSFERSRIISEDIRKQEQYQSNISNGLRQSRLAQQTLEATIDRLIDIKQIVTHGASDSSTGSVRENMAEEVAGIRESLVHALNLNYGDRYLFAGTNSGEPPFEMDDNEPGGVANHSNGNPPQLLVADKTRVDLSITGEELTDTGAGDLFEIIENIEEALINNDTEQIGLQLEDIDTAIDHVVTLTSRLANSINRMEYLFEQYESSKIARHSDISELVDTDYARAFSDLQRTQVAFESAMAVHTKMFGNTLLNYL